MGERKYAPVTKPLKKLRRTAAAAAAESIRPKGTPLKGVPLAERRERLAKLIERGEITAAEAALIDLREPSKAALVHGAKHVAKMRSLAKKQLPGMNPSIRIVPIPGGLSPNA